MNYIVVAYVALMCMSFYKHKHYWNVVSFSANSQIKPYSIKKE